MTRKIRFGVCLFGERPLPEIVARVKLAEDLGYDSVWIADTQMLCRELYVTLTACALNTSRIKLGAGVTAPYTRHASVTASAFATLNELAEGRLLLGVSTGNSLVRTIGQRPARIEELEDYVGKLKGLLANRPVEFEGDVKGKITWMNEASGIPIYVAGTGPKLIRAAARMVDGVIIMVGSDPALLRHGLETINAATREAGKSSDEMDVICWVPFAISREGALAREHVGKHVAGLLKRVSLERFDEEDWETIRRIREGSSHYPAGRRASVGPGQVPKKLIDMLALAGTPEEIRERVKGMTDVDGFSTIVLNTQVSADKFPSLESALRLFAEGVMAHVA